MEENLLLKEEPPERVADCIGSLGPGTFLPLALPGVNLATAYRSVPEELRTDLRAWVGSSPPVFKAESYASRCDLSRAFEGLSAASRSWLAADVQILANRFSEISNAKRIFIKFRVISDDECRKFHVDRLRYRLIATYLGPGTEWVPEQVVNRDALGKSFSKTKDANERIVVDYEGVCRAHPGEVVMMKGSLHSDSLGAVHRSPPIEGLGLKRVVLALSTVEP